MRPWIVKRGFIAIILLCTLASLYLLHISYPIRNPHVIVQKCDKNSERIEKISEKYPLTTKHDVKTETNLTACALLEKGSPLDTSRVINPHPYVNIAAPQTDCEADVFLVVYVHSSTTHHQRRALIRQTWGNVSQYDEPIRVIFITGIAPDNSYTTENAAAIFQEEIRTYGDIIQSNFLDTYRNLTIKAIAGLKWITEHCSSAKYVLKADDDAFVNMHLVLRHIKIKTDRRNILLCNLYSINVNREGKWKTTYKECSINQFPIFCQGLAFVMMQDVAKLLFNVSQYY